MHILLKIKEHLFHIAAHFFETSVSLLDCLVAAGLAKISEKNCLFLLLRIFYVFCIVLVDSIMKVRAAEMCVSRKDQPSDVSMVACGPVCVPAFSPVCVCVGEAAKKAEPRSPIFLCQPDRSFNGSCLLPVSAPVS